MKSVVGTNHELCVGCNRCTRACPVEAANLTYLDGQGAIKVKVDGAQCIACGACISVCRHQARYYTDDLDAFLCDLERGVPVSVIAAPSLKTVVPQWKRLLSYLRDLGVTRAYDAALGADICVWAHLRHIERNRPGPLIAQPCAAIVSYCELHRPELLDNLSPVHSPMACAAVYMKRYEGVSGRIAALSPCIAKAHEFEETGLIDYNVTFTKLNDYLNERNVWLPERESGFDHPAGGLGSLFPTPGGLQENIERMTGGRLRVDRAEGPGVYHRLDEYAKTPGSMLPRVFDVLSCEQGCNGGSGCAKGQGVFQVQSAMHETRRRALKTDQDSLYASFDERLRLDDFLRDYQAAGEPRPDVTEAEIEHAFALLEKHTFAQQNFNCGACGSDTCRDMARKIALGINIPLNCIVKSRDDMQRERRKNAELYRRNAEYIEMVHRIGDTLSSSEECTHTGVVDESVRTLCVTLHASGAYLWRRMAHEDGRGFFALLSCWSHHGREIATTIDEAAFPDWFAKLSSGAALSLRRADMTGAQKRLLPDARALSVLAVPVVIKGEFWGFVALHNEVETHYDEEDVSVVAASGVLIVNSIIEFELNERLVAAREEALAGMRAKSEFLSRMSHEMRTPMNAIIGMTQIASDTVDMEKMRRCIDTIQGASNHLLGLINDVLDMSKIEAGKLTLSPARFNLEKMLMKISNMVRGKVEEKHQSFRIVLGEGVHTHYVGDELRLSQVAANILGNAVKFTPEHGRIALTVEFVAAADDIHKLRFTVEDSGIGMSEAQKARLFGAFQQADDSIAQRFGGTGLGLAISKSIVEKMNGRIWAESELGQGSRFQFEVELARDEREEPTVVWGTIRPSDLHVLIVDADEAARRQFGEIMRRSGIASDAAASGAQALERIDSAKGRERPYDVVFMDCELPDMGVLTAVRRMNDRIDRNTVIILTSMRDWNHIEREARALGVTRYLTKPLFPSTVINEITGVVSAAAQNIKSKPAHPDQPDFSDIRLLLAEDIEINREVFQALLENTGIRIETAENGRIAYEVFAARPDAFDMIVMDIQMPEMDGFEATRAIRALPVPRAREIPIIAMTANAFQEDVEKCLACGMNGHLAKPIDVIALKERIAHYGRTRR